MPRLKAIVTAAIEDLIRPLSGPLGIRLRRAWYRQRLGACGMRLTIEPGVHFVGTPHIRIGDDGWIDRNAILIAGPIAGDASVERRGPSADPEISIGDRCHIGIGTIIQGHGGVTIGDGFTSSPGCKLYSLSNDVRGCRAGTVRVAGASAPRYIAHAIRIGDNVWLGIDVKVIGHAVGSDSFVRPGSVVSADIAANSVAGGDPARVTGRRFADGMR